FPKGLSPWRQPSFFFRSVFSKTANSGFLFPFANAKKRLQTERPFAQRAKGLQEKWVYHFSCLHILILKEKAERKDL
ncbi:MAG: hypothetical protein J6R89_04925, partial [Clostridia bacterium]|nr:hypothetical protein [Clostridia bacterium]